MNVIMKCVNIKLWGILGCFHYILNAPRTLLEIDAPAQLCKHIKLVGLVQSCACTKFKNCAQTVLSTCSSHFLKCHYLKYLVDV